MAWLAKELQMQPKVATVRMKLIHITIVYTYVFIAELTNAITAGCYIENAIQTFTSYMGDNIVPIPVVTPSRCLQGKW